ncbi:hypothetical protein BHM03_00045536 [Ensete ventricosum]|nr:hypothetical protein BHM03_00045536 [Ensete ventricosum]
MIGAMELQPDDGLRSSLSIGPRFGRYSGISPEFARRFTEGIGKLAGNMSGDYQKKIIGLIARIPEVIELARVSNLPVSLMVFFQRSLGVVCSQRASRSLGRTPSELLGSAHCIVRTLAQCPNLIVA